jgi:hypothetical protein
MAFVFSMWGESFLGGGGGGGGVVRHEIDDCGGVTGNASCYNDVLDDPLRTAVEIKGGAACIQYSMAFFSRCPLLACVLFACAVYRLDFMSCMNMCGCGCSCV